MLKKFLVATVAIVSVSEVALANKIIDLNTSKSKVLFESLKSVGAIQSGNHINVSEIYCSVNYEKQSGDPGQKPEILAMASCNFDGNNNIEALQGNKADKLIAVLAQSGVLLGKSVKREAGVTQRSLFVQSISCSKYLEQGQTNGLKEVAVEVHICSVKI